MRKVGRCEDDLQMGTSLSSLREVLKSGPNFIAAIIIITAKQMLAGYQSQIVYIRL